MTLTAAVGGLMSTLYGKAAAGLLFRPAVDTVVPDPVLGTTVTN